MVCDMILTTVFMTLILLCVWRRAWPLAAVFFGMFFTIEVAFLSASVLKACSRDCCSSSLILLECEDRKSYITWLDGHVCVDWPKPEWAEDTTCMALCICQKARCQHSCMGTSKAHLKWACRRKFHINAGAFRVVEGRNPICGCLEINLVIAT